MSRSLISDDKECWVCKTKEDLHRHHIYGGPNRGLSEAMGCWVYLCARHHNMSNQGVHFNHDLDIFLKKICQRAWEKRYGDTEKFRIFFGRSYL